MDASADVSTRNKGNTGTDNGMKRTDRKDPMAKKSQFHTRTSF